VRYMVNVRIGAFFTLSLYDLGYETDQMNGLVRKVQKPFGVGISIQTSIGPLLRPDPASCILILSCPTIITCVICRFSCPRIVLVALDVS